MSYPNRDPAQPTEANGLMGIISMFWNKKNPVPPPSSQTPVAEPGKSQDYIIWSDHLLKKASETHSALGDANVASSRKLAILGELEICLNTDHELSALRSPQDSKCASSLLALGFELLTHLDTSTSQQELALCLKLLAKVLTRPEFDIVQPITSSGIYRWSPDQQARYRQYRGLIVKTHIMIAVKLAECMPVDPNSSVISISPTVALYSRLLAILYWRLPYVGVLIRKALCLQLDSPEQLWDFSAKAENIQTQQIQQFESQLAKAAAVKRGRVKADIMNPPKFSGNLPSLESSTSPPPFSSSNPGLSSIPSSSNTSTPSNSGNANQQVGRNPSLSAPPPLLTSANTFPTGINSSNNSVGGISSSGGTGNSPRSNPDVVETYPSSYIVPPTAPVASSLPSSIQFAIGSNHAGSRDSGIHSRSSSTGAIPPKKPVITGRPHASRSVAPPPFFMTQGKTGGDSDLVTALIDPAVPSPSQLGQASDASSLNTTPLVSSASSPDLTTPTSPSKISPRPGTVSPPLEPSDTPSSSGTYSPPIEPIDDSLRSVTIFPPFTSKSSPPLPNTSDPTNPSATSSTSGTDKPTAVPVLRSVRPKLTRLDEGAKGLPMKISSAPSIPKVPFTKIIKTDELEDEMLLPKIGEVPNYIPYNTDCAISPSHNHSPGSNTASSKSDAQTPSALHTVKEPLRMPWQVWLKQCKAIQAKNSTFRDESSSPKSKNKGKKDKPKDGKPTPTSSNSPANGSTANIGMNHNANGTNSQGNSSTGSNQGNNSSSKHGVNPILAIPNLQSNLANNGHKSLLLNWVNFHQTILQLPPETHPSPGSIYTPLYWVEQEPRLQWLIHFESGKSLLFVLFFKEWVNHVVTMLYRTNELYGLDWSTVPGFKQMEHALFNVIHPLYVSRMMMPIMDSTKPLVRCDPEAINWLVRFTFCQTNAHSIESLNQMFTKVEMWFSELDKNLLRIPASFDVPFFLSGLNIIIEMDHHVMIARMLTILFTYCHLFRAKVRTDIVDEFLVKKYFFQLFLHWDDVVRNYYHQFIIYKAVRIRKQPSIKHGLIVPSMINPDSLPPTSTIVNRRQTVVFGGNASASTPTVIPAQPLPSQSFNAGCDAEGFLLDQFDEEYLHDMRLFTITESFIRIVEDQLHADRHNMPSSSPESQNTYDKSLEIYAPKALEEYNFFLKRYEPKFMCAKIIPLSMLQDKKINLPKSNRPTSND